MISYLRTSLYIYVLDGLRRIPKGAIIMILKLFFTVLQNKKIREKKKPDDFIQKLIMFEEAVECVIVRTTVVAFPIFVVSEK